MRYTITNANNDIVRNILSPVYANALLQVGTGETLHEGHYPANEYTYDGQDFAEISEKPVLSLVNQEPNAVLWRLIKELKLNGINVPLHAERLTSKQQAKKLIDMAAGRARFRLVSDGVYVDQEYLIAEQDVDAWIAAGSDEDNPPIALDEDWLTERNITAAVAAAELKTMASAWKSKLMDIRRLRLLGKAKIDNATSANFKSVAQTYIEYLNAL